MHVYTIESTVNTWFYIFFDNLVQYYCSVSNMQGQFLVFSEMI